MFSFRIVKLRPYRQPPATVVGASVAGLLALQLVGRLKCVIPRNEVPSFRNRIWSLLLWRSLSFGVLGASILAPWETMERSRGTWEHSPGFGFR